MRRHKNADGVLEQEGGELAEMLSVLEVEVNGDYNDFDGAPLYLHSLAEKRRLSCDFEKMARECLYLTYMGNELADRPDEIYRMMENFGCHDTSLEHILQTGNEELPQFDEFLARWIRYLGERKSRDAGRLLCEAQTMLQDEDAQIENARKYVANHPSLYKQLLEMKLDFSENEKMLAIGMEALDKIPRSYVIRSEIALLAAGFACKLQNKTALETCWLEAFRSDSTVTNYLRIRLRMENWTKYKDAVEAICEQTYKKTEEKRKHGNIAHDLSKQRENHLYKNEYCFLLFLEEQFDKVFQIGMNEKNALGWSSTFMKQGLALFLLLLYNGEDLPAGLGVMLSMVSFACGFKADEYLKGTNVQDETDDKDMLWKLFCQWKRDVQVSDEQREAWLNKIEKWIALRVEGIMNGNHRDYYGECASYIAAFGEVQESMGVLWGKARFMEKYKNEYSRRRAFHQELRKYGMGK